jgi:hypothetical protein
MNMDHQNPGWLMIWGIILPNFCWGLCHNPRTGESRSEPGLNGMTFRGFEGSN